MTDPSRGIKHPAPPALPPHALMPAMLKTCGRHFAYMEGIGAEIERRGGNTRRSPEYRAASAAYEAAVGLMADVLLTYEPIPATASPSDAGEAVRKFKGRVMNTVRDFSHSGMTPEEWVAHRTAKRDERRTAADAAPATPAAGPPPHPDH